MVELKLQGMWTQIYPSIALKKIIDNLGHDVKHRV